MSATERQERLEDGSAPVDDTSLGNGAATAANTPQTPTRVDEPGHRPQDTSSVSRVEGSTPGLATTGATTSRVTATIEVDGDSLRDVVNRLYDIAVRLDERHRVLPVQMVGGHHIVTVREADKAPRIDWREAEGG